MTFRILTVTLLSAVILAACGRGMPSTNAESEPGPPVIDRRALDEHVRRLTGEDLARRPAGSRAESLGGTYVLGHLQIAGYVTVLDPVPVADLVRSTNIVAVPPGTDVPEVVVVAAYDTPPGVGAAGEAVAAMLELARALKVARPRHDVSFVGLGADHAGVGGGRLGSRRMASDLLDRDIAPVVITIAGGLAGSPVGAAGAEAERILDLAAELEVDAEDVPRQVPSDDVFARAGFDALVVEGDPVAVARVLLAYLQDRNGPAH